MRPDECYDVRACAGLEPIVYDSLLGMIPPKFRYTDAKIDGEHFVILREGEILGCIYQWDP